MRCLRTGCDGKMATLGVADDEWDNVFRVKLRCQVCGGVRYLPPIDTDPPPYELRSTV